MGDLLHGLASGTLSRVKARSGFQVGVRVVVPPFPYDDPRRFESTSKDAVILFKTASREGIQAYNRVRNVMIPSMYYREDIGDRWSEEDSDRLHSWGYLRET